MATDHNFIVKNGLEIEGANATIVQDGSETRITSTGEIRFRPDGSSSNKVRISLNTTHISGNLQANGINHTNGNEVIELNDNTYTILRDPEATPALYMGDSGDAGNYYDNNHHNFRASGGGTPWVRILSSGINVQSGGYQISGTTVIDSSRQFTANSRYTFGANSHYFESGTNSVAFKNGSGSVYWISNNSVFTLNTSLDLNSDSAQLQFGEDNDMQIFHNGAGGEINNATGNFTIDSVGDIILDADGGDIKLEDAGVRFGTLSNSSTDLVIQSNAQDRDIIFKGNDGGSTITALTLDMSEGGEAIFAGSISSGAITSSSTGTFKRNYQVGENALNLLSTGNAQGVGITFSDNGSPPSAGANQRGFLSYYHADSASYGSGNSFIFDSTETSLTVLAKGKLMTSGGLWSAPSSGTGAGTQIIDTSRNLLNIGNITSSGSNGLTVADHIKATGNNLKFHAGGTHVLNIDLNGKIYPQTDASYDLGFNSSTARFRDAYFTGTGNFGNINTGQGATEVYLMNQNVRSSDSPTFADLTVTGNLTITGDINSYNVTDLDVTDKTITVGAGQTEANSGGSGLIVGGSGASILWDESNSEWDFNNPLSVVNSIAGDTVLNLTASYASSGNVALLGFARSGGAVSGDIRYLDATTEMEIGTSTAHSFSLKTSNTKRLTINSSGNATFSGSVEINHNPLILDTNPAATYGVSEALRIDDNAGTTDRQLQFFELLHSGARSHRLAFNTNITTNGSAYTHTQGLYGGSSAIHFGNSGEVVFYVNSQVTSGSADSITPTERFRVHSDGKVKITGSGTIGGNTPTNGYLQITDGSNTLAFDNNEIHTTDNLYLNAEDGIIYLRGNDSGAVTLKNGAITFMDTTRNLMNIGTISSGALTVNSGAGVSRFHSHHTTIHDDWQVSPISIRERGLNSSNSTNNQYSPNLNFHWDSVVSRSLTMTSDGNFTLGEWTSSGTPSMSSSLSFLNTGGYRVNNTNVIDANRQIFAKTGTQVGEDGSYAGYGVVGFGGITNGYNRIFGRDDTNDGLFIAAATGRKIFIRSNGSGTDDMNLGFDDTYTAYRAIGFGTSSANGVNKVFAHPSGSDGIYIAAATGRQISFRTNGSASDTFTMTPAGEFKVGATVVLNSSRNLTNIGTISSGAITTSGNLTFSPSGDYYAGLGSTNALHFENSSGQTLMSTASVDIRIDANNSDTNRFFSVSHNSSSNATSGGTDLFKITEDGNATFAGNISHTGLTPTSGTDIDQIKTVTVSATLSTSWQDTGIDGSDLSTGTYIVQVFVDDHSVGGGHYDEYYSGTMSWVSINTNSTKTDEILLHRAGHAPNNGDFFLRTERTVNADSHDLMLQMRGSTSNTGNSNYVFKFRRMI